MVYTNIFAYEKNGDLYFAGQPVSVPPRTDEVLTWLLKGYNDALIAEELGMKLQTAKNRIQWWFKATGMNGPHARIDLVLKYALGIKKASDNGDEAWASLTLREQRLVALLALNPTSELLTKMTGIRSRTVNDLLSRDPFGIFCKLAVESRLQLVVWYISHRFDEWVNEPCPCPFPNSKQMGVLAGAAPNSIHDRAEIRKGASKSSRKDPGGFILITDPADLCRAMGITPDLFPNGLLARHQKRSSQKKRTTRVNRLTNPSR